jgi:hypothetical protein
LACELCFVFLSTSLIEIVRCVGSPDHAGWPELLFSTADSCVILQLQLFGQLLLQQGEVVQF